MASGAAAEPRALSWADAHARMLAAARVLVAEEVALEDVPGRALAAPVTAPHALPPFDNSSMDGWAVRAADLEGASPDRPVSLPVSAVVPAGAGSGRALAAGHAVRIMTGALLPAGADAIVPFEDAAGNGARVAFTTAPGPGDHVRRAGSDVAAGLALLAPGRELTAHDVGLLGALGIARVPVVRRARVAVLSTGDELLRVDEPLRPGMIRDSNTPMLGALLRECGAEVVLAERLPDDPVRVAAAIASALENADVVLSIGGISAGDFDPVKGALGAVGDIERWRVAMKPGRPQAFGAPRGRLFHALPGNPASVACVFETLTRPLLRRLMGFEAVDRPRLAARAGERIESRAGRTDFVRVTLERDGDGWRAHPAGEQVSGHLLPQSRAHALLVVPHEAPALEAGGRAEALVLHLP